MDGGRTWVSIQHLRGLAALAVALFHACQWTPTAFGIGEAGVDVFFVISGFVMWTVTSAHAVTPGAFIRKRLIRVAPLYWLVTLGLVAAALIAPARFSEVDPQPLHVLLSLGFIQHVNPAGLPFPVLTPGWTLNYEAVFYVIFAGTLLLPESRRLAGLTMALIVVSLSGFVWREAYQYLLNPLFLEFAAGACIGRMAQEKILPDRTIGWVLLGAGLILLVILWQSRIDPALWRPMIWGAPAALVVAGAVSVEADGGWPRWRAFDLLGDSSYSLYLTHQLTIGAVVMTFGAWRAAFVPVAVLAAAGVGVAIYLLLEKPMLAFLRRRLA
ncbi:MAG: acyltransferase [Caulobacter sp.]|nr:acyltransferase [Caulobacter sp.]